MHGSGSVDGVDSGQNFTAGSRVEVVCEDGYRFPHTKSTVLHIICHSNGSWTDLLGSEIISSCQCKCITLQIRLSLTGTKVLDTQLGNCTVIKGEGPWNRTWI